MYFNIIAYSEILCIFNISKHFFFRNIHNLYQKLLGKPKKQELRTLDPEQLKVPKIIINEHSDYNHHIFQ